MYTFLRNKKVIGVSLVFACFLFVGFGCKERLTEYNTSLTIWGVFDLEGDYREVSNIYTEAHPFVEHVTFRKFTIDTYKDDLINALAAGNGPDIFMIHNSWLPAFADKVSVAPQSIVSAQDVRSQFVDVVAADTIRDDQVFALAPSVDSLALYYNKDIFNAAGITSPPETWEEFDDVVTRLTRIGDDGRILQSGAALGTAQNVSRPTDILTALMMQGGAEMRSGQSAAFNRSVGSGSSFINPGRDALLYYTTFARGGSSVYTWNNRQHHSIDSFFEGTTAMTISYSYNYDTIRTKNEKLNFAIAPLPQIDNNTLGQQANYGNYWMYVVAKNRPIPEKRSDEKFQITNDMKVWESWQFLKAFTLAGAGELPLVSSLDGSSYTVELSSDLAATYLAQTKKPAARLDLLEAQKNDQRFGAFALGNLIARSWERNNADAIDGIFFEMIDNVNRGQNIDKVLDLGAQRTTQLLR